jgi:hypothetical protein
MDILTLELRDVTVFQALVELRAMLSEHHGEPLRVVGEDETLRLNVANFLEKQGRAVRLGRAGSQWELRVEAGERKVPSLRPDPSLRPAPSAPRPVLLLRSAFAPGDRALGRRLLLDTLGQVEAGTPWLCLAHQAVELLEDPMAVGVLEALQGRGIPIHVSLASLAHGGQDPAEFTVVADAPWQKLLAQGGVTVL